MGVTHEIRVGINGYDVIGGRVAEPVSAQDDMVLTGVADVGTDWRLRMAGAKGFRLFVPRRSTPMRCVPPGFPQQARSTTCSPTWT